MPIALSVIALLIMLAIALFYCAQPFMEERSCSAQSDAHAAAREEELERAVEEKKKELR